MNEENDRIVELQETLQRVMLLLDSVNADAEREFLSIGHQIQGYYTDSKNIKATCVEIAETFSAKLLQKNNEQIEALFKNIQAYFQHLENEFINSEAVLKSIHSILESLEEDLTGYDRIIKFLRMLGISTRIESVRLFHENNTFEVIAVNVDKLSGVVQEKTNIIREHIKKLNSTINEIQEQIVTFQAKKDERTKEIYEQVQGCMAILNEKYAGYSTLITVIANSGDSLYSNMSNIVSDIQFHDITRQQIEHVQTSLDELSTELASNQGGIQDLEGYCAKVCRVQIAQLTHSRDTLRNAVEDLSNNLEGIGKNAEDAITHTISILGTKKTDSINFIDQIGALLNDINNELKHSNELSGDLSGSIREMLDIAGKLSMFIYEIEEIGSEIELIALNASIKAAHTGKEGAGLGVIADSIQKISSQATDQSEQTAASLRQITGISEDIQKNIQSSLKVKLFEEVKGIDIEVNRQLNETHEFEKSILSKINTLQNSIRNLGAALHDTIKKMSIEKTVSRTLNEGIDLLSSAIGGRAADESLMTDSLHHLKHKYTMKSERDIHHSLVNSSKFPKEHSRKTVKKPQDESYLGDNVELF